MNTSTRNNRRHLRAISLLLIFLTTPLLPNRALVNVIAANAGARIDLPANSVDKNSRAQILESYGSLPLSFESNQGQSASQVKFLARGSGYAIFLTEEETVIKLLSSDHSDAAPDTQTDNPLPKNAPEKSVKKNVVNQKISAPKDVLRIKLVGANRPAKIRGVDELPSKSNYFTGREPFAWRTGISNFAKVHYEKVYDGVDMIFYGQQKQLEYDFHIAAGVNPKKITLALEGAERLQLDAKGDLVLTVGGKEIRQRKPVAFQEINGKKQIVAVQYQRKGRNRVGFRLGHYDKSRPLVIDPVLVYGTYLGGSEFESGSAIAVDASGCAYVTGTTSSQDFPLVNPLPPGPFTSRALFVSKLNPTGTALLYSSMIRCGPGITSVYDIKVNSSGEAYIVGETPGENLPTVNAIQPLSGGQIDAFVMKLSQTGSSLIYSTYLGGMYDDKANSIAVDGNDNAIIAGSTQSPNFPLANPLQPALNRVRDAFITKLNSNGSAFAYSTYLGGTSFDEANGVATDAAGNAYVVGNTQSGDFPLKNPVQSAIAEQTLLKSTDGGATWTPLTSGLPAARSVYDIEIDPTESSTLYLAAYLDGAYKSTNGGTNWSALNIPRISPSIVNEIEIAPSNPSTLYAGLFPDGVIRSTDGGVNWGTSRGHFVDKNTLVVSPTIATNVYRSSIPSGTTGSTDGGDTFEDLGFPFPGATARSLAISPSKPDIVYVGTDFIGIWKYTSNAVGNVWSQLNRLSPIVSLIVVDPSNLNTLYAVSSAGLSKSTDGGATWVNINAGLNDPGRVETLAVDPGNSSVIYAGARSGFVYKSVNGGTTWNKLREHAIGGGVQKIEIDPNSPNTIYIGGAAGGDAFVTKIDPAGSALMFSTYFGGKGNELPADIAIDSSGNPIITGSTGSLDLPTTSLQQTYKGSGDAFVAKFNIASHTLAYATYLGGTSGDSGNDVAVDAFGNVYVAGSTSSTNFPTTPDAIPLPNNGVCATPGCFRAFLTKLNANGSAYLYSTYIGGSVGDFGMGVAVDLAGNAYVTGRTHSTDFPTTPNAFDRELSGQHSADAFMIKIADGTPFPVCLKDETNGYVLRVNTSVGEFEFVNCRKGWSVRGRLNALINGCKTELTSAGKTGARISALINTCIHQGNATVTIDGKSYIIANPNLTNNDCNCSTQ
jgi:photosystem II stability/assembly factor-like uncharacterized protein